MISIRFPRWACLIGRHCYRYKIEIVSSRSFLICIPGLVLSRNYLV